MARWWLAVGPPDNWRAAFETGNIWGLKASGRPAIMWEAVAEGDGLIFYVSLPVKGVIGYGVIRRRFRQDKPLWPQEVANGRTLWPLRIEFDVEAVLPVNRWSEERVVNQHVQRLARGGFQPLEEEIAKEAIRPFRAPPEEKPSKLSAHDQLIEDIIEIGRLQKFIAEKEYPMEGRRLDAVWRRVERSVPTYAFEVQIGANLDSALAKLKHAYDLWNSRLFLIADEGARQKVSELLSGTFHEIRGQLRFIEVAKLQTVLEHKQQLRNLEAELGLL